MGKLHGESALDYETIKHKAETLQEYNQIKEAKDLDDHARARYAEQLKRQGYDKLEIERQLKSKGMIK